MLGTWSGHGCGRSPDDFFIRQHIEKLNTISHSLSQISVGYPHNPKELIEHTDYIQGLKALDDGTPIVVYPMENNGRSYGQYSRIFDACRDQFTHYIFIEDDYVPCLDGFDVKLKNMFEGMQNCGLLCGMYSNNHAAISNGITSYEVLKKMWGKYGVLYFVQDEYTNQAQKEWSYMFMNAGYEIHDWIHEYRSLYYQHSRKPRSYSDGVHQNDIIIPIQCWGNLDGPKVEYIKKKGTKPRCQFI